jgi:hypothetical protein
MLLAAPRIGAFAPPEPRMAADWNSAALQGIRDAKLSAPAAARALAIVHTCMYDAWSAYDEQAVGTQLSGALRRSSSERTLENKEKTISYAAYRALADVLPVDTNSVYIPLMKQLGYDPTDNSTDIETPAGIGNVACAAVLEYRHHDNSNQLGDLHQGPYSDWTNYRPVNSPGTVPARLPFAKPLNPEHWQPLTYTDSSGSLILQMFSGAQWGQVTPFAITKPKGDQFRSLVDPGPPRYGFPEYQRQAEELIAISAGLTDKEKMIAEYWNDGPDTEQPPGHWMRFAQFISQRDHHTLDDDVKMFFALSNAMLDASIAAPSPPFHFCFAARPSAPGVVPAKAQSRWTAPSGFPIRRQRFPRRRPPNTFLATAHTAPPPQRFWNSGQEATVLETLSLFQQEPSKIEPAITPAEPVTLHWETFTDAADEAGTSRLYAGIHFHASDLAGRRLGRAVAAEAWTKAQSYFAGTAASIPNSPTSFQP